MDLELMMCRVRNEFIEMPDLRLSEAQAMRLMGLGREEGQRVIDALVAEAFLARTARGQLVRAA
jgi:hypothetical protein